MPITLNVSLTAGGRVKPVSSHTLDEAHISIGRDKECSLTLEDTQKHVSRVHADLDDEDGVYLMTVVSKVNPVIVNGKRYMYGERVALSDGDVMQVGLYKVEIVAPEVDLATSEAPTPVAPEPAPAAVPWATTPAPKPAPTPAPTPAPVPPPEVKVQSPAASIANLPEDLVDDMTYIPPTTKKTLPPQQESPVAPVGGGTVEDLTYIPPVATPADKGTSSLGTPSPGTPPLAFAPGVAASEEVDEDATFLSPVLARMRELKAAALLRSAAAQGVPQDPAPVVADAAVQAAGVQSQTNDAAAFVPPPSLDEPPIDPAAGFEAQFDLDLTEVPDPPQEAAPASRAAPEPEPITPSAPEIAKPPATQTPRPPAAQTLVQAVAPSAGSSAEQGLRAFLEGAGTPHLAISDPEAFLRDSGALLRSALEGVSMLLAARAQTRGDFGLEAPNATEASEDNPLESMADPAKAIAFLLDPAQRAGTRPDSLQTLAKACDDLRVHQAALLAAMRAAVLSALHDLDPKVIEREQGVHLGGLNLSRKSKLWDLSIAHHDKFALQIKNDFNKVFGPEILPAYLSEVRRLRGEDQDR